MKRDPERSTSLGESSRRVIAWVLVLAGHLGLLLLLLRPSMFSRNAIPLVRNNQKVLELRLLARALSPPAMPAQRTIMPASILRKAQSKMLSKPLSKPLVNQPASAARARVGAARMARTQAPETRQHNSPGDGGFQQRLHEAQQSYAVHGVPGSETPSAAGIHLVDPMHQGIGAVMRTAQRAFGISNRHCIDVDVWHHLTPQELSARFISPDEVDETDRKYGCNEPPGLHF